MRRWRRQPLRVQLVLITVVLGGAALVVAGGVAAAALRGYLVAQVDEQLRGFVQGPGPGAATGEPGDRRGPGGPDDRVPGEFYVQYRADTGTVQVLSRPLGSGAPEIPALTQTEAARLSGQPFTEPGTSGSGSWRIVLAPAQGGVVAVAKPLAEIDATVGRLVLLELVVGGVVLALLALAATLVVRRNLRPLVTVEHTASAIARGDLSRRVPPGEPGTEVGELAAAVNAMLDEIARSIDERDVALGESRASEERMRQFVADASHELRTPLTSIRGYAELFRAGGIGPPDVPATFARVEGESQRMAGLVDDLLLLARLDQQRPLDREPVDLLALANDVVQGVRIAFPNRTVKLAASGDEVPVVVGDEARLRQVIANIVANAVKYTDGAIEVRVRGDGAAVLVSVADHGPGIPEADKARVFERFHRGEASRTRSAGGTGLGLSIVAAIVKAHGGTVTVRDNPGGGVVFEVSLPAR